MSHFGSSECRHEGFQTLPWVSECLGDTRTMPDNLVSHNLPSAPGWYTQPSVRGSRYQEPGFCLRRRTPIDCLYISDTLSHREAFLSYSFLDNWKALRLEVPA